MLILILIIGFVGFLHSMNKCGYYKIRFGSDNRKLESKYFSHMCFYSILIFVTCIFIGV
jgi:hypothetical protein